jgi:CRP/FNR family cyclic AMP-dependent transcriptional regulator
MVQSTRSEHDGDGKANRSKGVHVSADKRYTIERQQALRGAHAGGRAGAEHDRAGALTQGLRPAASRHEAHRATSIHPSSLARSRPPQMLKTKAWFIRQNPILADLPERELEALEQISESIEVRRRQLIWEPGDPASTVYLVRTGIVKVSKISDEGRELTLHFFTRDQLFGELSVISDTAHDTVAEAYEDTTLLAVGKDDFNRMLLRTPVLAMRMMRLVGERRQRLENRVENLLFRSAHARLASLFIELAQTFGVRDSRGVIINLKLTHKEIASLIGATRETVSFAILDLRKDNLIQTEGKRVILLDEPGLKALRDA